MKARRSKTKRKPRSATDTSAILLEAMTSLAAERDFDVLLQTLIHQACHVMNAERATLFLLDENRGELWSKVAEGATVSEIRVPLGSGIAGHVAATGETVNIKQAYRDRRFNPEVDRQTGYRTRTILCVPLQAADGKVLGVIQVLNKRRGTFKQQDEELLRAFGAQAATALRNALLNQELQRRMQTADLLLNVMRTVSTELHIDQLLKTIVGKISAVMDADRCTLFLVHRASGELWSRVAQGAGMAEIRVGRGVGIAGHVALSGETVNITDAYHDPRFNPEVDRQTGYRTRSILCMPVRNDKGEIIGALQVLNKRAGVFTEEDEELLAALGAQIAIALENSRLFEEVRFMQNYNESILRTMATGVVTLERDGAVGYTNLSGLRMFSGRYEYEAGQRYERFFDEELNPELTAAIRRGLTQGQEFTAYEFRYHRGEDLLHMNLSVLPLSLKQGRSLGVVMVAEDITQEQRLMTTFCRYVTRQVAEQILQDRDKLKLGGNRSVVTVLFADIRSFTSLSERSTAEEVVTLLNEYFKRMIEPIFQYEGTLDKFIGDAIMAVFGAPVPFGDDAERAVRAAMEMRRALQEYNRERAAEGLEPIENGIGITKGEAVSGNIGSEQRMDYTVIGDTVNVASRLEGLTKNYACKILINEGVYAEVKDKIPCVDLGLARLKGKEGDVRIYGISDSAVLPATAAPVGTPTTSPG